MKHKSIDGKLFRQITLPLSSKKLASDIVKVTRSRNGNEFTLARVIKESGKYVVYKFSNQR
jgi:hypothetical protein